MFRTRNQNDVIHYANLSTDNTVSICNIDLIKNLSNNKNSKPCYCVLIFKVYHKSMKHKQGITVLEWWITLAGSWAHLEMDLPTSGEGGDIQGNINTLLMIHFLGDI